MLRKRTICSLRISALVCLSLCLLCGWITGCTEGNRHFDTETVTNAEVDVPAETAAPLETTVPSETSTKTETETASETKTETATETETEMATETETETATETETETASETETETVTETETETETVTETATETETETATETETETATETETETVTETETETVTETETETVTETETGEIIELETRPPATETEFVLSDPTTTPTAEMPRLDIITEGGVDITSTETYVRSTITLSRCDEVYAFAERAAGVRVRGNSTAGQIKKPYRIKFDTKQSFLGLNDGQSFKSWCLMADFFDASFLRTWVTFRMAEVLLEGKYYSSDCTPVEVYLNGSYNGVYLLCEQTQINRGRVNIPEKADGDTAVEIGYLMIGQGGRFDEPESMKVYPGITVTDRLGASMYVGELNFALSGSGYTQEQKDYVSRYVSGVYQVIDRALRHEYYTLSRDGTLTPKTDFVGITPDEKQRETIAAVFDLEAAARMCILDELVKDLDASTFNMYVDLSPTGDGVLTLAAPWDFDFALGNCRHASLKTPLGYYATNLTESAGIRVNPLYVMLGDVDWFEAMMSEIWKAHYNDLRYAVHDVLVNSYRYTHAYARDYTRWGIPSTHFNWDHHDQAVVDSYQTQLDAGQYLHDWLVKRVAWLERKWGVTADLPVEREPLLEPDLTNTDSNGYRGGTNGCTTAITDDGLKVTIVDAYDPYFYVKFNQLEETFAAEDYPILELICLIPESNTGGEYTGELFLCAGDVSMAQGGVSTTFAYETDRGVAMTYRFDLEDTGFWEGDIHRIRVDFMGAHNGDVFYITSFKLLPR